MADGFGDRRRRWGARHLTTSATVSRKLLTIGLVLVLLVALDSLARTIAASSLSSALASPLELPEEPDVSIEGFPFLLELAGGRFEAITVRARELDRTGIKVERVRVTLDEVSFSVVDALTGELDRVRVRSGHGTARLSNSIVESLLTGIGSRGVPAPKISIDDLAPLEVDGTTLIAGPTRLELPVLVSGMSYRSARVSGSEVFLTFRIDRTTLSV